MLIEVRIPFLVLVSLLVWPMPPGPSEAQRAWQRGLAFQTFLPTAVAQRDVWLERTRVASVSGELVRRLAAVGRHLRILVVAEDWCLDSANTVPYVAAMAAGAGVDLHIVDRARGKMLMEHYTTADGRVATPLVVLFRDNGSEAAWVERPRPLQDAFSMMAASPRAFEIANDRQRWYDLDNGQTTLAEIVALAEGLPDVP